MNTNINQLKEYQILKLAFKINNKYVYDSINGNEKAIKIVNFIFKLIMKKMPFKSEEERNDFETMFIFDFDCESFKKTFKKIARRLLKKGC